MAATGQYDTGTLIGRKGVFTPHDFVPDDPADGKGYLYFKSGGGWYVKTTDTEHELVTTDMLTESYGAALPIGAIVMWFTATAPAGWLFCDGQTFNVVTYPALLEVLASSATPDMRNRFPLGKGPSGPGSTLTFTGGSFDHSHAGPSHVHTGPSHQHSSPNGITSGPSNTQTVQSGSGNSPANSGHTHTFGVPTSNASGTADTGASGTASTGGASTGGAPPYMTLNFIIKAL